MFINNKKWWSRFSYTFKIQHRFTWNWTLKYEWDYQFILLEDRMKTFQYIYKNTYTVKTDIYVAGKKTSHYKKLLFIYFSCDFYTRQDNVHFSCLFRHEVSHFITSFPACTYVKLHQYFECFRNVCKLTRQFYPGIVLK